jgi:hypothetical protein
MNKKDLVEYLKDVPDDYEIVMSNIVSYPFKTAELSEEEKTQLYPDGIMPEDGEYQIIVDIPVVGVGVNPEGSEVRFVLRPADADFLEKNIQSLENFLPIVNTAENVNRQAPCSFCG